MAQLRSRASLILYKRAIILSSIATFVTKPVPKDAFSQRNFRNAVNYVAHRLKFAVIVRFLTAPTRPLISLPLDCCFLSRKPAVAKIEKPPVEEPIDERSPAEKLPTRDWTVDDELEFFREYLRILTSNPNPDYKPCVEFLERQASSMDLPIKVYYPVNNNNPIIILTWVGTDPSLSAILLNSHMDVVPAVEQSWKHQPFDAEMNKEGKIYGAAETLKSAGMMYLGAIRALKRSGERFKRTIHVAFAPDEEICGYSGLGPFVCTDDFEALKVGFAMDEGIASPTEVYPVFYAERAVWHIHFKINGTGGDGSLLLKNTPGEKLLYIVNKMMERRAQQALRLDNNPNLTIGDVTSINLTKLSGGNLTNVVPHQMIISFDVRFAIDADQKEFEETLNRWCAEAGGDIELVYEQKRPHGVPTRMDNSNPYWQQFKSATDELLKIKPQIFPDGTDSRYFREIGIPAIGFLPMNNAPLLVHDRDEYITADTYMRGIEIYKKIIAKIANTGC